MTTERIELELGEKSSISLPSGSNLEGGEWRTTGSAAVLDSEDLSGSSVEIVGASIGRVNAFYKSPLDLSREDAVAAKVIGGDHLQKLEEANTFTVEVEVVAKKDAKTVVPQGISSDVNAGLLPMDVRQAEPSEKTPYGMDQFDRPVAPTASMTAPGGTNIARESETAEATGAATPTPTTDDADDAEASTKAEAAKAAKAEAAKEAATADAKADAKEAAKADAKAASKEASKSAPTKSAPTKSAPTKSAPTKSATKK